MMLHVITSEQARCHPVPWDAEGTGQLNPQSNGRYPSARASREHGRSKGEREVAEDEIGSQAGLPSGRLELRDFLHDLRTNSDGTTFPQVGRHRSGILAKSRVAAALGVSPTYYNLLELNQGVWTEDRVETICELFRLEPGQRALLWQLTLGRDPRGAGSTTVTKATRVSVDEMPVPAFLVDRILDIVYHNEPFAECFPSLSVGDNFARFVLNDPAARDQFLDWAETWARPMIVMLNRAEDLATGEDKPRIEELIDTVRLADTEVGRMWLNQPADYPGWGTARTRWMVIPGRGRTEVIPWNATPLNSPNLVSVAFIPIEDAHRRRSAKDRAKAAGPDAAQH